MHGGSLGPEDHSERADRMTDRWCMVRNGLVENVVIWDGDRKTWSPPDDVEMVLALDGVNTGHTWDGKNFAYVPPIEIPSEPDSFDLLVEKLVEGKALKRADADMIKAKRNG